jgi:hypothetical protein
MHLAATLLVFQIAVSAVAAGSEPTVEDYLRDLPKKYRTHYGDFRNEPTPETTIKDLRNGYIAFLDRAPQPNDDSAPYPIFEIAVFKQANTEPLIVVSNTLADSYCVQHESFFLRKRGTSWQDVRAQVLPAFSPEMFFAEAGMVQKLEGLHRKAKQPVPSRKSLYRYLHFSLPREGTRVKVTLDLCKYAPSDPDQDLGPDYDVLEGKRKLTWLEWNRESGTFKVAR